MYTVFAFPGQGLQFVGMGKDLYENFSVARDVFHEINDVMSERLTNIMFNGPINTLTLTKYAQLAIMAMSMAIIRVLEHQSARKCFQIADYVAGHSLGEYSALCAADSLPLYGVTKLLKVRADAMHAAASECSGNMAACFGITMEELKPILKHCSTIGVCEIANDNILGRVVISGHTAAINLAIEMLRAYGKKAIRLNVSGPFHCSLMAKATKIFQQAIDKADIKPPKTAVIANYSADIVTMPVDIKNCLIKQIERTVRWREILNLLQKKNVSRFVEIGPGKVLINLAKQGQYNFKCSSINSIHEIDSFLKNI
ncbi:malonyl CoA-acyl carrier protein transacylase [Orientia chuto str. Dubai]|uniref:Malonyl CoA-acyl carrier protein transacylase n=1 Tax=Orientia chuto str. Dubai TaxID=1359168 RepID=A0A0F3MPI8_9RICK|nr:ACP S-malonyltransferase [Candidatus Orientia mediorientalis]KJV56529.1 malonyl CoA-acyl carrier protein transacylase [Orientia chuto str. Dubai]